MFPTEVAGIFFGHQFIILNMTLTFKDQGLLNLCFDIVVDHKTNGNGKSKLRFSVFPFPKVFEKKDNLEITLKVKVKFKVTT